jgi:hypothetical protein
MRPFIIIIQAITIAIRPIITIITTIKCIKIVLLTSTSTPMTAINQIIITDININ